MSLSRKDPAFPIVGAGHYGLTMEQYALIHITAAIVGNIQNITIMGNDQVPLKKDPDGIRRAAQAIVDELFKR